MRIFKTWFDLAFRRQECWVNQAKLQTVKVAGGCIEYCRFGSGQPLILSMGYASTLNGWDARFLAQLAQEHEVIVYNNRNIGNSQFGPSDYSIQDLANDLEQLRCGLGLTKIAVGGISMGGIIAQMYAHLYPCQLSQLILINSLPPGELMLRPSLAIEKLLRKLDKGSLINYWRLLRLLIPGFYLLPVIGAYHFNPLGSLKSVAATTIYQQQQVLEGWAAWPDVVNFYSEITTPTLILSGLADKLIAPKNSEIIALHLENAELLAFRKAGHIMTFEYPQQLAEVISRFIHNS